MLFYFLKLKSLESCCLLCMVGLVEIIISNFREDQSMARSSDARIADITVFSCQRDDVPMSSEPNPRMIRR